MYNKALHMAQYNNTLLGHMKGEMFIYSECYVSTSPPTYLECTPSEPVYDVAGDMPISTNPSSKYNKCILEQL